MAYYPMTHGKLDDAHASEFHGKAWRPEQPDVPDSMMVAADLRQTEARDGPEGDAVALNNSKHIELPDNVTRSISGDRPRTVCLWARIDKWKNKARIFEYGRKAPQESCSACAPGTSRASLRSKCHGTFGTIGTIDTSS